MGADQIVCAGDLVGYGPFPDRVISFLREHEVRSVRGNHDRWALERGTGVRDEFGGGTPSAETLQHLRQLPKDLLIAHHTTIGVIVHGSPRSTWSLSPGKATRARFSASTSWDLDCELLVVGHTHRPMWFRCREGLVVNPGSIVSGARIDSSRTFARGRSRRARGEFSRRRKWGPVDVEPWS